MPERDRTEVTKHVRKRWTLNRVVWVGQTVDPDKPVTAAGQWQVEDENPRSREVMRGANLERVEVMPVSEHEREVETRAKILAGAALREQTERLVEANAEVARLRGIIDEMTPERRCECGHRREQHAAGRCGGVVRSLGPPQGVPFYRSCCCAGFRECS